MPETIPHTVIDCPPSETNSSAGWAVSLAFWLSLLIAALMYGSIVLAPRLFASIEIRHDFITNAHQLQALESEIDYLERVRNALRSDPEFARRMTTASIAEDVGEVEIIPVSGALMFGSEDQQQERIPGIQAPMGAALVRRFASDQRLRSAILVSACLLVVCAFTVLNGTGGRFVALITHLAATAVRMPLARYRKDAPSESPLTKPIVAHAPRDVTEGSGPETTPFIS